MTDRNEAMRLADELVAPIGTQTSYQTAHQAAALLRQQAERIAELELQPTFAQLASYLAVKLAAVEAEREQLRAELALRPWRPISPARIAALWAEACKPERPTPVMVEAFVRLVEADHGIDHARTTHKETE